MHPNLVTEETNRVSAHIDSLPTLEILEVINSQDRKVAIAVRHALPQIAAAVDAVVGAIEAGGRVFYLGAGTSGRLGVLDAAECPPTFNVPPDLFQGIIAGGEAAVSRSVEASEDDPTLGARDLGAHGFTRADILVGIAASGRTPYVLGAVRRARALGAKTVGLSCNPQSELSGLVDFPIEAVPGPEVIAGSTRMRAGTATKMVLNMISTAAMIRTGHVYRNLMVTVQPSNEKLLDRARRIVAEASDVGYERAAELLEASGRVVKTAIVMEKRQVSREVAERLLAEAGGRVAEALRES
jgi:N-acetylmuramic acid 6-phosphate etherase